MGLLSIQVIRHIMDLEANEIMGEDFSVRVDSK
jgi:hypothetical protein